MGIFDLPVAMLIAFTKAALVIGFFMGLRWDKGLNRLVFFSVILFLLIFLVFTLMDTQARGYIYKEESKIQNIKELPLKKTTPHH